MALSNGDGRRPNPVLVAVLGVLAIVIVSYLIPVAVTGDALWFRVNPAEVAATATSVAQVVPTDTPELLPTEVVVEATPTDGVPLAPGDATDTPAPAAPTDA